MANKELIIKIHDVADALGAGEITFSDFHDWLVQKLHFGGEPQVFPDEEVVEALKKLSLAIIIALNRDERTWIERMSRYLGSSIAKGRIGADDLGTLVENKLMA